MHSGINFLLRQRKKYKKYARPEIKYNLPEIKYKVQAIKKKYKSLKKSTSETPVIETKKDEKCRKHTYIVHM